MHARRASRRAAGYDLHAPEHLGEALRAASTLRIRAAAARDGGTAAASDRAGASGQTRRHRHYARRRRGGSIGHLAGLVQGRVSRERIRGVGRSRSRGAGLSKARAAGAQLAHRSLARAGQTHSGAPREGRVLGQRDQARATTGAARLSRVHAQGLDRRLLSRLRQTHDRRARRDLSAIRHAQRAQRRRDTRGRGPPPRYIYPDRRNSAGLNLADRTARETLDAEMETVAATVWHAAPCVAGHITHGDARPVYDPSDRRREIGTVIAADAVTVERAVASASEAAAEWDRRGANERAAILERAADLFEEHRAELMTLCVREGGKTVVDALAELREAVDFCRYYATAARRDFATPHVLPGPTGEHNELQRHGRGVFACISPWNFPLAIFTGQIAAALVAGNAVLAKRAGQTPLGAHRAIELLHAAGVPGETLHFLPGSGALIGGLLAADERIAGIAFTGSTATAKALQRALAAREGAIATLIAETGGQNAMIVDSSALPEQVVKDVLRSGFNSAGQRCSALRVLYLQEEIAPKVIEMLCGAMAELRVGDPALLATDVGPVIAEAARAALEEHATRMTHAARLLCAAPLPADTTHGSFFAPCVFEIDTLAQLPGEVFGPVLHVIRYAARDLDRVIDEINGTGYGLTLGVHSRVEGSARYIQSRVRAGNCNVYRDVIGAVVGVLPFGGEGLSGTGPKAGGPDYLLRFSVERTLSVNIAAVGGNTSLLSLQED